MNIIFSLFLVCFSFCNGAKILGVFNHPGASHTYLGKVLLKNLAQRGHEVVMISSFPMAETVSNYKDISLPELLEDLIRRNQNFTFGSKTRELQELRNMTLEHTEATFKNDRVRQLLNSNETFDVIIMDWFYNEATLIFGHIYQAPVIYLSSFGNMALLTDFTGNVLPFSYVPGAGLFTDDDMSFKHRTVMTLFNIVNSLFIPRRYKAHHEILTRHFKNPPLIEELQKNVALVLSNSHFSFETPRPYTPNIIPVGGLHIEDLKELPKELKEFLDNSKEGVIYFSLGSQIKSSLLNDGLFRNITLALGKVPQKVLWKLEDEPALPMPQNIKTIKWVPQLEVLAHPNVKLFITHGGMLSLIEAVHFRVPMICVPFNGDQLTNAAFVESRNIGRHIFPDAINEDILFSAVQEVINNPKYQEQVNYRSSLLREQPRTPMDLAIFWVEHVIKHGHGNHLKTFAIKLPWYKYYLLDVIFVLVSIIFIALKIITFSIKKFIIVCMKRLGKKYEPKVKKN